MPNGFTFNGVHSSAMTGIRVVVKYGKDLMPDIENKLLSIPNMDGVIDMGYTFKERVIPVSFFLEGTNISNYFENAENVAKWLNTGEVKPLILDGMPNRTFQARINSKIDPERVAAVGQVDVDFLVPKVYSEGIQVSQTLNQSTTYTYNGNYKTFPVITVTVAESISFLKVTLNNDKFILVNRAFVSGDIIVIDTQNRKISLGAIDLRPLMDITSDWFYIDSNYKLTLNSATSTIQIVMKERWI